MKQVRAFTDGACSGNPGPGGWGAVLQFGEHERELHGGATDTTNNRMELTAAIEALKAMLNRGAHCFWHQEDDVTLTSNGYIWTYPGKQLTTKSICVLPELKKQNHSACYGICTDYPMIYKEQK